MGCDGGFSSSSSSSVAPGAAAAAAAAVAAAAVVGGRRRIWIFDLCMYRFRQVISGGGEGRMGMNFFEQDKGKSPRGKRLSLERAKYLPAD